MENRKIHLMIIDEKMNSVVVELEPWQFKQLGIKPEDVRKHKTKTALRQEITEFLLMRENNDR